MTEPTTKPRAALIEAMIGLEAWSDDDERSEWVALIEACEAEAVAAFAAKLRAGVKAAKCDGLHTPYCTGTLMKPEHVLALIDQEAP